ncbi:hypothetical protein WA026_012892 [Henosepilachna vigintioctopunctata]|uniref:Uncharacterized protein n=1 Tax=Henosepilachna vigintioctopunctata TaxID=420089 RepID=A0AAW1TTP0_9CUCU
MEEDTVGSPVSLLLLSQLTPKSQRTCNFISNPDDIEDEYFSIADFSVLNREIECVIKTNSEDDELRKEAEALSQSIKN